MSTRIMQCEPYAEEEITKGNVRDYVGKYTLPQTLGIDKTKKQTNTE